MSRTICGICWCTYDDDIGECGCSSPVVRDDTALLRQALEALESNQIRWQKKDEAVTALRERLGEKT